MTEYEEKPFTLSREDLYELVWSKPMRELAKDFGISDVTLAKHCRSLAIPIPGRGYWARRRRTDVSPRAAKEGASIV